MPARLIALTLYSAPVHTPCPDFNCLTLAVWISQGKLFHSVTGAKQQGQWQLGDRVVVNPSLSAVSAASRFANRGDVYGELGVIGLNESGGHAEFCAVPASHIHAIPDHIDFDSAATFPTAWMTAQHGLFSVGHLQPKETVLIHAAASGVSSAAIQLAKAAGATVLATAGSAEKCAHGIRLGRRCGNQQPRRRPYHRMGV